MVKMKPSNRGSRIVFATLFTPVVDDFLALPPRNGPPGLRFFAYYRREGRRLRGLGPLPLPSSLSHHHRMNERMNGRRSVSADTPARADRRPRWPLSPPPLRLSPISVPPVELLFLRPPPWWKEVEMIRLFQGVN